MKKRMVAIALAAAMVMTTFAGCGGAEETVETQKSENTEKTSEDAVKNLIASTKGTVTLNLWCDETESYQKTMKQLVEDFKNQYDQVDFDITIGAVSTANCKDEVLADVEKAADVFVLQMISYMIWKKQGHYRVLMQHLHMIQKKKMRKRQWRRLRG